MAKVEVSVDGGQTWRTASLVGPQAPYSWTLWEYLWQVNTPKDYRLVSRAISTMGETQPADHDSLRGGYMINFFRPHPVRVIPSGRAQDSWGDRVSRLDEMVLEAEELSRKRLDIDLDSEFSDGGGI